MYKLTPQEERILTHMLARGSITSVEAYDLYGCTRLAAVVANLKKKEIPISTVIERGINRYGDPMHYSRYSIRS